MPSPAQPTPQPLAAAPASRSLKRWIWWGVGLALLCYLPFVLSSRSIFGVRLSNMQLLNIGLSQVNLMLLSILGALSLTYLTGRAGLISIGHAALYAVGAIMAGVAGSQWGWPFPVVIAAAGVAGAFAGVLAGLPSLRVRGLYFLISTMALHYIVIFGYTIYQDKYFDVIGIRVPEAIIGQFVLDSQLRWYFFLLPVVAVTFLFLANSLRGREGRAMMAMRDHELAATAAGVDVRVLRLKTFAFTSAIAAMGGALLAYYMTTASVEIFSINFAIQFIAMIIVGGMGSLWGAVIGAAIWMLVPSVISGLITQVQGSSDQLYNLLSNGKPQLVNLVFGLLVIVFLIRAPGGIAGIGRQLRNRGFFRREK